MKFNSFGKTGLNVSSVGLGTVAFSEIQNSLEKKKKVNLIKHALQNGFNIIDTSLTYGASEKIVYEAVSPRNNCYIATKGEPYFRKEEVVNHIEYCLKASGKDSIDLYQIHNVSDDKTLDKVFCSGGILEILKKEKRRGRINSIGITGHNPQLLLEAINTKEFDSLLVPYNLLNQKAEDSGLFEKTIAMNIGVMVMKPLAGGILAKPNDIGITVTDALSFIFSNKAVHTTIVGVNSTEEIDSIVAIEKAFKPLSEELKQNLINKARLLGSEHCRYCGDCLPCPQRIDIPSVLRFKSYYYEYGLKEWSASQYNHLSINAAKCLGCEECEKKCPYNLPIKELVAKADVVFNYEVV